MQSENLLFLKSVKNKYIEYDNRLKMISSQAYRSDKVALTLKILYLRSTILFMNLFTNKIAMNTLVF